eukprot:tig00020616_g12277.t1
MSVHVERCCEKPSSNIVIPGYHPGDLHESTRCNCLQRPQGTCTAHDLVRAFTQGHDLKCLFFDEANNWTLRTSECDVDKPAEKYLWSAHSHVLEDGTVLKHLVNNDSATDVDGPSKVVLDQKNVLSDTNLKQLLVITPPGRLELQLETVVEPNSRLDEAPQEAEEERAFFDHDAEDDVDFDLEADLAALALDDA